MVSQQLKLSDLDLNQFHNAKPMWSYKHLMLYFRSYLNTQKEGQSIRCISC